MPLYDATGRPLTSKILLPSGEPPRVLADYAPLDAAGYNELRTWILTVFEGGAPYKPFTTDFSTFCRLARTMEPLFADQVEIGLAPSTTARGAAALDTLEGYQPFTLTHYKQLLAMLAPGLVQRLPDRDPVTLGFATACRILRTLEPLFHEAAAPARPVFDLSMLQSGFPPPLSESLKKASE